MSIHTELEHANYVAVDKSELNDEVISGLSRDYRVLLVCDLAKGPDEARRRSYADALVVADLISREQEELIIEEESLQIIIPLHTLQVATEIYRRIPHASHFVSMYLDGAPYSAAC